MLRKQHVKCLKILDNSTMIAPIEKGPLLALGPNHLDLLMIRRGFRRGRTRRAPPLKKKKKKEREREREEERKEEAGGNDTFNQRKNVC